MGKEFIEENNAILTIDITQYSMKKICDGD